MKNIILSPEQNNLQPLQIIVRDKTYRDLKKMQYTGGFKRFGLSIYSEAKRGQDKPINYDKLGEWLGYVFQTKQTIN